ncbi:hypothetical protein CYY_005453 [Polysphondylium violaceum]|uniref:Nucleolar 27S pre-rRNA processing Urb2/Npa2 C-terminal domain-containing protein n=1 Tax=Polysphondylium violaceum TaxID=133409 RepID=A0A8J4Q323_9MYCE|nr:hypothetical protein CYY_005453 [Polysphondylium violaceum]
MTSLKKSTDTSSKKRKHDENEKPQQQQTDNIEKKVKIDNKPSAVNSSNASASILALLNTTTSNSGKGAGWEGATPIESLSVGELVSSLTGRQHNLRIVVAEYIDSLPKLIGFPEKSSYLLNWTLDNLSKSFVNWKQPEKAQQLIEKNIEPLCFEQRYWTLLESLSNKQYKIIQQQLQQQDQDQQQQQQQQDSTNNIKLSVEYLTFFFEILLNSIRNLNSKLSSNSNSSNNNSSSAQSKKKKAVNVPYLITSSPPPPKVLLEITQRILPSVISFYSSEDVLKEIPALLENAIPIIIVHLGDIDETMADSEKTEYLNTVFDLFNSLFNYILNQVKLGTNSKTLFTVILNQLLPSILMLLDTLETLIKTNSTFSDHCLIAHQLLTTIQYLLKWSLYHPDSHWDSYPQFLFHDWLKKANNSKDSKDTKSASKEKTKTDKEKEKQSSVDKEQQQFQCTLVFERISQLLVNKENVAVVSLNDKSMSDIVASHLDKFLEYFIEQVRSISTRFSTAQWFEGDSKEEHMLEFGYFRKIFNMLDSNKALLEKNPSYYTCLARILNKVSEFNIFYTSNQPQTQYLTAIANQYSQLLLQSTGSTKKASAPLATPVVSGVYLCLAQIPKISHLIIESKITDILSHCWSNQQTEGLENYDLLVGSLMDCYFSIRQMDTLLSKVFSSISNGKIRKFNDTAFFVGAFHNAKHLERLFAELPFGQVPIIWNLFLDEYKDNYLVQINEPDDDIRDPLLAQRLTRFVALWVSFFDSIKISSFVYKMVLQLLPNTYAFVVDPLLNEISKSKSKKKKASDSAILPLLLKLYSSFLQVHSFINRQTIIKEGKGGENDFGYHPQQFYYYQLCEKELEFSKVVEYICNTQQADMFLDMVNTELFVQRIQQLHSILSSVSLIRYQRTQRTPSFGKICVSSYEENTFSPQDIETEITDIVAHVLSTFISKAIDKCQQDDNLAQALSLSLFNITTELESVYLKSKLLVSHISTWCDYASTESIQAVLGIIVSPIKKSNKSTTVTIKSIFHSLLTNPMFFELKVFQKALPYVLSTLQANLMKSLVKNKKVSEKIQDIYTSIKNLIIDSPTAASYAEIIADIKSCFEKTKLSSTDVAMDQQAQWEDLIWLVSLAPSFHPQYFPIEMVGPLVLSAIVVDNLATVLLKGSNAIPEHFYQLVLSTRKFTKFAFEKDQSRLVQIIPMETWINMIVHSNMYSSRELAYPILYTSLEIQYLYNNELWEHSPMELKKLTEKIMNLKDCADIQLYLISTIFQSISNFDVTKTNASNSTTSSVSMGDKPNASTALPPDLTKVLSGVETRIKDFITSVLAQTNATIGQYLIQHQPEFMCSVYYHRYAIFNNDIRFGVPSELASTLSALVSKVGVFISSLNNQESTTSLTQLSLMLQISLISLVDLYSRIYSKISPPISSVESLHILSLLTHMQSCYADDSKLYKMISSSIIIFIQTNNQLGYLLNSIINLMESPIEKIQLNSFQLLFHFISAVVGTKRINLLKNPLKLVCHIVNIINQTQSQNIIISALNLLSKLMSINSIDSKGECIPIILCIMNTFENPFIFSTPLKSIHSFHVEAISSCPMTLFTKDDNCNNISKNSITNDIFNSIYRLLYIVQKYKNDNLINYLPAFVSCLRYLLYSIANQNNDPNEKTLKKMARLFELLSSNKKSEIYFQSLIVDYVQLVKYSTTITPSSSSTSNNNKNNSNNNSSGAAGNILKKKQFVGPQYYLSTESRSTLLPGIFSLIEKCDSNNNKELFTALDDTSRGIFQTLIDQYQSSFKYTGK